jgi:hypothetical protein
MNKSASDQQTPPAGASAEGAALHTPMMQQYVAEIDLSY